MKKINKKSLIWLVVMALSAVIVYAITYIGEIPTERTLITNTTLSVLFSINATDNMTGGALYINDSNVGALTCYNSNMSGGINFSVCNRSQDLSGNADGDYRFYFITSPTFQQSGNYNFTIDTPPAMITGLRATAINTTALNITWNASERDIQGYNLYKGNTSNIVNNATYLLFNYSVLSNSYYIDTGLSTGITYFYLVEAVDLRNQTGLVSNMANGTVVDETPPVEPSLNPVSGSTVNTTTPTITINYTLGEENVTLNIYSGNNLIKNFPDASDLFIWNPTLNNGTSYNFVFNATDTFNNQRRTNYTITTSTTAGVNFSVIDTIHITTPSPVALKSSVLAGEYMLYNQSISMYTSTGNGYVRVRMNDITGPQTIDIPNDIRPYSFCEEDYNSSSQDVRVNPQMAVYYILNQHNESATSLNCTDTDSGDSIAYNIIVKIPIPAGVSSGSYATNIYYGMYDTQ